MNTAGRESERPVGVSDQDGLRTECRLVAAEDVPALSTMLRDNGVAFLGMPHAGMHRAVLRDAVQGEDVSCVVAVRGGQVVGWTVAIVYSRRYWTRFLARHPILGFIYVGSRLATALFARKSAVPEVHGPTWPRVMNREWGGAHPTVARHLDITVLEAYRRGGVATALQSAQIADLKRRGVRWLDAYINTSNLPSILLHIKNGWSLVSAERDALLISLEI